MKKEGDIGELEAIVYLKNQGYLIVETNFKFGREGEIDIVARKDEKIVFFEVKKRKSLKFGSPEESLTKNKRQKILKTIYFYCLKRGIDLEKVQFDFLSILGSDIVHYKNVEL